MPSPSTKASESKALPNASGSPAARGPDHQAKPDPAADLAAGVGAGTAGEPGDEPYERWTHEQAGTIAKVGDVEILGPWVQNTIRGLPARVHKEALAMGLIFKGAIGGVQRLLSGAEPAPKPPELARPRAGGYGVWTHHLPDGAPAKVGSEVLTSMTIRAPGGKLETVDWPWIQGEHRAIKAENHDAALAAGLEYLGPARGCEPIPGAEPITAAEKATRMAELKAELQRVATLPTKG